MEDPKPPKREPKASKPLRRRHPRVYYHAYIKSAAWAQVRRAYYATHPRRCRRCGATSALELHHKTYRHLGRELDHLDDLVCLCEDCHDKLHGGEPRRAKKKRKGARARRR